MLRERQNAKMLSNNKKTMIELKGKKTKMLQANLSSHNSSKIPKPSPSSTISSPTSSKAIAVQLDNFNDDVVVLDNFNYLLGQNPAKDSNKKNKNDMIFRRPSFFYKDEERRATWRKNDKIDEKIVVKLIFWNMKFLLIYRINEARKKI
jgi:hypothetical protein